MIAHDLMEAGSIDLRLDASFMLVPASVAMDKGIVQLVRGSPEQLCMCLLRFEFDDVCFIQ